MVLSNYQFGLLMLVAGMGLTLFTLWLLTLVMHFLKTIFPNR